MFGKNGFRNDSAQAAGANEQNCGDQMNREDNQIAHEPLAARNLWISE
jgi:hypothetical protein